ncbi:MAG: 2-hydroxyhepta-2,4-diene-1,7-dioate isomerase, partial [Variovorax paradoxus]
MKLLSYTHQGRDSWGALDASGQGVVDLGRRLPAIAGVRGLLEGGAPALAQARQALTGVAPDLALADVQLDLPVRQPRVFCIGVNYAHRNAEYKDGSDLPRYPSIFMRVPDSFSAHG